MPGFLRASLQASPVPPEFGGRLPQLLPLRLVCATRQHGGHVLRDHVVRLAFHSATAVFHPDNAVGKAADSVEIVRIQRRSLRHGVSVVGFVGCIVAERTCPPPKALRPQSRTSGPYEWPPRASRPKHPAGIRLDGTVDEISNVCEMSLWGKPVAGFESLKPRMEAFRINVFTAGEFRIESCTQFQQRRDPAFDIERARRWLEYSGNHS